MLKQQTRRLFLVKIGIESQTLWLNKVTQRLIGMRHQQRFRINRPK
ncbi:Uncharacterised protein [Vibrio cholerae]|nr:Uncharacterised protein [Vibrio cholerae]CSI30561.1 Uncharacterised protein [Vibrio cholerae]